MIPHWSVRRYFLFNPIIKFLSEHNGCHDVNCTYNRRIKLAFTTFTERYHKFADERLLYNQVHSLHAWSCWLRIVSNKLMSQGVIDLLEQNRPKQPTSRGCNIWFVCGGETNGIILFSWAHSINSMDMGELCPPQSKIICCNGSWHCMEL